MGAVKMNLASRLEKLEAKRPYETKDGRALGALLAGFKATYARIGADDVSADWLSKQSVKTALAIAFCATPPHQECVIVRLRQVADSDNAASKLATYVLEEVV
jgi:hypothetical protein